MTCKLGVNCNPLLNLVMKKIIEVLSEISPLGKKDFDDLSRIFTTSTLEKGDYWIQEGKKNNNVAFLENGYLRKYYAKDGNEITDFFYFENDFCADLPSIISNSEPLSNIVAMQPTTLTTFSYFDFNELCKSSLALEHLHRVIVEYTFIRFYNRAVSFILQTPKERYEQLIQTNPRVLQEATQYHIASYLGISPQHLSRLRGQQSIS